MHVAAEMGVSRQCAGRWVSRYLAEGDAGLLDRSSRPRSRARGVNAALGWDTKTAKVT